MFLIGIVLSRFGHSGFILCEMQARQETVPSSQLGLINGIAVSVNSAGAFLVLLLGAIFSDPNQFGVLVWTSSLSITACAVVSWCWALGAKGRHLEDLHRISRERAESLSGSGKPVAMAETESNEPRMPNAVLH